MSPADGQKPSKARHNASQVERLQIWSFFQQQLFLSAFPYQILRSGNAEN
jgi:hypothetical protein